LKQGSRVPLSAFLVALASLLQPVPVLADGVVANAGLRTSAFSNVFADGSEEWDLALSPRAELGYDFARIWSAGYTGELHAYTQHAELLSHRHELYLFANPAWGAEGENEFVAEVTAETVRNQPEFEELNLVQPTLLLGLEMEPVHWFRWRLSASLAYRLFYDDAPSDSVDAWGRGGLTFSLPGRTTLSPGIACGFRYYPSQDLAITDDDNDQQIEAGLGIGQALWDRAGLRLDYAYLYAVGDSGLLARKVTEQQFSYLDHDFLYSGHRASAALKQVIGTATTLEASFSLRERRYAGWGAIDEGGLPMDEDRRDLLLTPAVFLGQVFYVGGDEEEEASGLELGVDLEYGYTRQWSNSDWYDTDAHVGSLTLWGAF
jgi:hypothetical protein